MDITSIADRILKLAYHRGAISYGNFTLSSGTKSTYYFDGRRITLDAEGSYLIGTAFFQLLEGSNIQAIGGPTLGADPMVAAVATISWVNGNPLNAFIVRKEAKLHGTEQLIEGPILERGSRVAIVDDSCSTGGSIWHAISVAEAAGYNVVKVMAILDRHQGGSRKLRDQGYEFTCLLEADESGRIRIAV